VRKFGGVLEKIILIVLIIFRGVLETTKRHQINLQGFPLR